MKLGSKSYLAIMVIIAIVFVASTLLPNEIVEDFDNLLGLVNFIAVIAFVMLISSLFELITLSHKVSWLVLILVVMILFWAQKWALYSQVIEQSTFIAFLKLLSVMLLIILVTFGFFSLWFVWGKVLVRFRRQDLAIAHYTNLLRFTPKLTILYCSRAFEKSKIGDYFGALEDYNRAIELIRTRKNQAKFSGTIELQLDLGTLYGIRAGVYHNMNEYENAIADCDTGLMLPELRPLSIALLHNIRGASLMELKEYEAALADFELDEQVAIRATKYSTEINFIPLLRSQKALALHQLGHETDAAAVWQALVRTHPNYQNVEWLKNDMKWRDWQLDIAKQLINNNTQDKHS